MTMNIREQVEANRERVRNIRSENPNARPIDGYSWLVFDPLEIYHTSLDGHYKTIRLDENRQVVNNSRYSEDMLALIQKVVDDYYAEETV